MDGFIGPVVPTGPIPPPIRGAQKEKNATPFPFPKPDSDSESGDPNHETDSNETHLDDLPIGLARFDESGQRIDYTA